MQTGCRFRCYPSKPQQATLRQWIGSQRYIYNAKVREDRQLRADYHQQLSTNLAIHSEEPVIYPVANQTYAQFKDKENTPWLYTIPSQILRNGATRFSQAYQRFYQKLAKRPTIHQRSGKQSVWLTKELFHFEYQDKPVEQSAVVTESLDYRLWIGTKKHPLGFVEFKASHAFAIPNSIVLSVHANHWTVSFNYDDDPKTDTHSPQSPHNMAELATLFSQVDEATLTSMTVGIDRGVVQPFTLSTGEVFDFSKAQQASLVKAERKAKAWQRKAARREKGSRNQRKAYHQVAKARAKQAAIREDFAHKTSLALVSLQDIFVIAFEHLAIVSMTKKAKKKLNKAGVALRNHAKAKSALSRSILSKAWGKTKTYTTYKALKQGKLVVDIPAAYTSQQCHHCGHIQQENRLSQSEFLCQRCGHQAHADINAALNIRDKGVQKIKANNWVKEVKSCSLKKKRVGQELSERVVRPTPVEKVLDVGGIALSTQFSWKQEESPSSAKAS